MPLTNRSRLYCSKRRQEKRDKQSSNLQAVSASEPALEPAKDPSAQDKALQKYLHAKAIYEETKDTTHWVYMQKCLSEYESTLMPNLARKA